MTPASPPQPTKACTFDVSCPPGASVDSIFDAAAAIVGTAELFSVQHLGGTNFQLSVTSSSAMSRIVNAGALTIGGTSVPIVPVGPQVTSITCLYLPIYVRNEALAAALSLYGKVLDIRFGVYQDHPNLRTGTRYIRMEMKESTPVPNFLRVSGHRATFDYRGLKRVCRRCQQEGHLKAACNVPYCTRCAAFGHDTVGCAAGCGRCGAAHATVDCTQRRSYSAVAGCGQGDFPALTPASQTPKSQDRPPTTPPPPPAATVATQGSGDTSAPAEPPVTTPSEITPTSQQSQLASATDADSNASQDAAEAALSNAVETVSVHAHTPPSPGSGEVLVKEEPPPTPELRPSPLPSWSDITEDSASSSDDRLIIDEVACDKDSALPRGRDRRRGTSEELRKTCSRSRSPHGGAEDGKRLMHHVRYIHGLAVKTTTSPLHPLFARLRVITLNVQGFRSVTKQIEVLQFARTARCDLLFLQETNFHRQRDVDLFKQRYGVDCFFSYATTRSSGVGVVIFNRSLLRLSACCFDPDGRYIAFDFSLDGTRFRAVGVYAPAQRSQSPAFFKSLDVHLLDARNCLLLGDFNCVVDSRRDVRGPGYGRTTWNAGELIRLMQNFDLVDCWTLLHGTAFEHTWQRRDSSSRLDRCYTSEFLSHSVTACCAMNFPPSITYISDHRPVLVELHFSSAASSQRTWRLDTRLLRDKTSRDCLREALRRSLHGAAPDPSTFDRLQESWRVACVAEGRALRRRHAEQLRDTLLRIRIVRRGGAGTPLMRGYLEQLLDRYQRQLRLCTNAATAYHGRVGPSAHPEVLRYAHRTEVRERRVPSVPTLPGAPATPGQPSVSGFSAHFRALATAESTADRTTLLAHPFLRDLPQVPEDLAAHLHEPPNPEETYGSLSGARLNEQKSAVLWVNRPPDPSSPIPAKTSITILGVTYRSSGVSADMWTRLARDIGEKVDRARAYALPLAERRYLAYSVFCGRLWYLAQAALPTSRFIRRVKSALFSFFWSEKTELVTRPVVCLPRERGGWGFPCLDIAPTVLHLKTTLKILRDEHGPARSLALYFVGHSRRDLGVDSSNVWKSRTPQLDVVETPTARLTEVLLEPQISATQVELGDSFSWSRFTSSYLPGHLRDFEWQRGWGVLPSGDRLLRWGVSRTDECPNCGNRETNVHAVKECVVARTFWRVIRTSFHGLGVGLYLLRGRCPPGVFVRLLLAAAEYVLWRNRCCAVRQARRSRALWPLLWRLRRELVGHLEEQLFFLGEQEFLRRWSCRYLSVRDSRIELRFRYLDNL
ncbi:hypothetical protein HPB47_016778 [Ixodes persulcatus]|uniref:Uncharacterized protein n=1 Tax=Ixodes persulcatus TaxID=34615 RepID=A0AC60R0Z6_IXOPE|nr:hypothetical protein HPB47_016778 [Ixodes persulcatus]